MELLKVVKRRTFLSEATYVIINIVFAIALLIVIRMTGSIALGILLVFLSKWRVFAVRMRYWFANIQADLVSLIVSLGYVVSIYNVNSQCSVDSKALFTEIILTLLFIAWLLFLKNQSKRGYVAAQGLVSLLVGSYAIFSLVYAIDSLFIVFLMWILGYAVSRHLLSTYEEDHMMQLSISWGLVTAEISWIAYHWMIAYRLPFIEGILLPQMSVVLVALSLLAYKTYDSYYHHKKIRLNDILLPLLFTIGIIFVFVFVFNGVHPNIQACGA